MKKAAIAIAAILVVGGAGFTGWRQWQIRQDGARSPSTQTYQTTIQKENQPPSTEGGKYLPIPEWGIKFKVSDELEGASYVYQDESIIYVSSSAVRAVQGCESARVLSVQRGKKGEFIGPSEIEEILANNPDSLHQLGDYYYGVIGSPNSCAQDESGQTVLSQAKKAFEEAIKTVSNN